MRDIPRVPRSADHCKVTADEKRLRYRFARSIPDGLALLHRSLPLEADAIFQFTFACNSHKTGWCRDLVTIFRLATL